jgi:hypothetical protein
MTFFVFLLFCLYCFVTDAFTLFSSNVDLLRCRKTALATSLQNGNEKEPLLLRAAKGEKVERLPVWMMRQAGRHMAAYRKICETHKTFRERSENVDIATEIRFFSCFFSFTFLILLFLQFTAMEILWC